MESAAVDKVELTAKQEAKRMRKAQREGEKGELKQMSKEDTKPVKTEDLGKIFEMADRKSVV